MLSMRSFPLLIKFRVVLMFIACCHGHGLQDWIDQDALQPSYYDISTENIVRCEKLCQYQGKCAAVTFDKKERVCHMHESYDRPGMIGGAGRYLFKILIRGANHNKTGCDAKTQLALPSAKSDRHNCYNIKEKGSILCGNTFQMTREMAIHGYNEELLANTPLAVCKQKCIDAVNYMCKSFDFVRDTNGCHLQKVNSFDEPTAYQSAPNDDYYERDCAELR